MQRPAEEVTKGQLSETAPTSDSGLFSLFLGFQPHDTAELWLLLPWTDRLSLAFLVMVDCDPLRPDPKTRLSFFIISARNFVIVQSK